MLAPFGRGIGHPAAQNPLCGFTELIGRGGSAGLAPHLQENVPQPPALAPVAFFLFGSLPFEIHVVDQRVNALGALADGPEVALKPALGSRLRGHADHGGQAGFKAAHYESGLLGHRVREEFPQFDHAGAFLFRQEPLAGCPRAGGLVGEPLRHGHALILQVGDELGETFLKRPPAPLHIPDEMSDPERCEILATVPTRQSLNGARAFVLPNFLADPTGGGFTERRKNSVTFFFFSGKVRRTE